MKIKEIEYGELRSLRDYNNVRVSMRATVEDGEDPEEVYQKLVEKVREKIAEIAEADDWCIGHLRFRRDELRVDVETLEKRRRELVDELLREVRDRLIHSFTWGGRRNE